MTFSLFSKWNQRVAFALIAVSPTFAQGDSCSSPITIPANGHVDVDTSGAATSGFLGAIPCIPVPAVHHKDRFFSWVAPMDGDYEVILANAEFFASMTVYSGSDCNATCLEIGAVANGADSFVALAGVQTGDAFLIQIGGATTNQFGRGRLAITQAVANGCAVEGADMFEPNDSCSSPAHITPGPLFGLRTGDGISDEDYFSIDIPNQHRLRVVQSGPPNWVWLRLYQPNCGPLSPFSQFIFHRNVSGLTETRVVQATRDSGCADYRLEFFVEPIDCSANAYGANVDCALADPLVDGFPYQGRWVSQNHPDNFVACVLPGATLDVSASFAHNAGDINVALLERGSVACSTGTGPGMLASSNSQTDNEVLQWTNPGPDPTEVIVQVSVAPTSPFECSAYGLLVTGSSTCALGPITRFCSPALPNSTGLPTVLSATVDLSVSSGIHFESTQGPPGQFGYMLISDVSHNPLFISQGQLCFGSFGTFRRYNYSSGGTNFNSIGQFDAQGVLQNLGGTSVSGSGFDLPNELPFSGAPTIQAGQVWHFQLWHREDNGASNFSDGIRIPF